jgi:predicted flavoprotein YhiN
VNAIGAGPANLAFAASAKSSNQKILLIEMGKQHCAAFHIILLTFLFVYCDATE